MLNSNSKDGTDVPQSTEVDATTSSQTIAKPHVVRSWRVSSDELFEARLISPLILLFWIPQTILVVMTIYYDIRWSVFGNSKGINKWYTDNFKSIHASFIWIAKDMGIIGCLMTLVLIIGYLWMSKILYIAFFYSER